MELNADVFLLTFFLKLTLGPYYRNHKTKLLGEIRI